MLISSVVKIVKIGLVVGSIALMLGCDSTSPLGSGSGSSGSYFNYLTESMSLDTKQDFEDLYAEAARNDGYVTKDGVTFFVTKSHGDDVYQAGYWVLTINGYRQIVFSLNKVGENIVSDEYLGCLFATKLGQEGFRCAKTYNGLLSNIAYSKAYFDFTGKSKGVDYHWVGVVDNPQILEDNDGTKYESLIAEEGYSPTEGMFVVMPNDTIVDSGTGKAYNANVGSENYVGVSIEGEQNTIIVLQLKNN